MLNFINQLKKKKKKAVLWLIDCLRKELALRNNILYPGTYIIWFPKKEFPLEMIS